MNRILRGILIGLIVLIVIGTSGIAMALHGETFVSPWLPGLLALALGASTSLVMWKWWIPLTGTDSRLFNTLCHIVTVASVAIAAFYGANYAFADRSTHHTEMAVVEGRYSETRYHSRRVGRRVVGRGEPYKVYHIEVCLTDGQKKRLSVPFGRFRRIHTGDTISLPVEQGALGFPVIRKE